MSDEIEAFLRRAAQRRAEKQSQQPANRTSQPAKPAIEIYGDEVVEAEVRETPPHRVERVEQDFYAEAASEMDADPRQSELLEKMRQLEEERSSAPDEAFDYDANDSEEELAPIDIHALLTRPGGIREAVILTEILNRPKRW